MKFTNETTEELDRQIKGLRNGIAQVKAEGQKWMVENAGPLRMKLDIAIHKRKLEKQRLREEHEKNLQALGLKSIPGTRCRERSGGWQCSFSAYQNGFCKQHDPARPDYTETRCSFRQCRNPQLDGKVICAQHLADITSTEPSPISQKKGEEWSEEFDIDEPITIDLDDDQDDIVIRTLPTQNIA